MIWKRKITLEALNAMGEGNMVGLLDIRFEHIGDDTLEATMPVDSRTKQPFGLLHGGASVVLAESIGSVAGYLCTEGEQRWLVWKSMLTTSAPALRRAGARRMQTVASRFASPGLAD
ncbi:hotdog fold thioesterase [Escherichia coli]|nr:hotdog fold thioesterase [Escherichia coli]